MDQLTVPGAETASTKSTTLATREAFKMANRSAVVLTEAHPFKPMAL